jgi:hypothetical protein
MTAPYPVFKPASLPEFQNANDTETTFFVRGRLRDKFLALCGLRKKLITDQNTPGKNDLFPHRVFPGASLECPERKPFLERSTATTKTTFFRNSGVRKPKHTTAHLNRTTIFAS